MKKTILIVLALLLCGLLLAACTPEDEKQSDKSKDSSPEQSQDVITDYYMPENDSGIIADYVPED